VGQGDQGLGQRERRLGQGEQEDLARGSRRPGPEGAGTRPGGAWTEQELGRGE
jgi:hypothetical protein